MQKILAVLVLGLVLLFAAQAQAAGILADVGADDILGVYLHGDTPGNLLLKINCDDESLAANSKVVGDFTECACSGYSAITLTRGAGWTITTANDPSDAIYTQQTINFTGACTTNPAIYGYYITNAAGTVLIGAERLASSFTPANGYSLAITPKIVMGNGTP